MKNLKFDPNEVKFILHEESDGIRIEEKILLALVRESAEDCTSPEGVMTKLHIRVKTNVEGETIYQLCIWEGGRRRKVLEEYDNELEAEVEWTNRIYEDDFQKAEWYWCDSEEECLEAYAENHGISVEDARKMIKK
ncbi:MAG: hypothetical protein KBT03_04955 [Bacteroidales bacterium]|nr:hypothetical protein [Candidatus Scybalousia scybalohippi]